MSFFEQLRSGCKQDWQKFVEHEFVKGLADGSLAPEKFRHYLAQDYLFLIHFARAYALAVYKADNLADMRAGAATIQGLLDVEMKLHVSYCAGWGLNEESMAAEPEATQTLAYTRYVLETGMAGDALDLAVALAPCVMGYGEIGRRLAQDPNTLTRNNPYSEWIQMYSGDEYVEVVTSSISQLDRLADRRLTEARSPALHQIFSQATRLETAFWDMGWNISW